MYQYDQILGYIDTFLVWYNTVYFIHRFDTDYPLLYQSIRVKHNVFIGWFTNTLRVWIDCEYHRKQGQGDCGCYSCSWDVVAFVETSHFL